MHRQAIKVGAISRPVAIRVYWMLISLHRHRTYWNQVPDVSYELSTIWITMFRYSSFIYKGKFCLHRIWGMAAAHAIPTKTQLCSCFCADEFVIHLLCKLPCITIETKCICYKRLHHRFVCKWEFHCPEPYVPACVCAEYSAVDFIYLLFFFSSISIHCFAFSQNETCVPLNVPAAQNTNISANRLHT